MLNFFEKWQEKMYGYNNFSKRMNNFTKLVLSVSVYLNNMQQTETRIQMINNNNNNNNNN